MTFAITLGYDQPAIRYTYFMLVPKSFRGSLSRQAEPRRGKIQGAEKMRF